MFITAVAMPLLQKQFNMTAAQQGSVGAFLVIGAMVGATLGGRLSDRFGRRRMFIVILIAFLSGFSVQAFANSLNAYLFWQIELGAAIGVGYPVCATYISETMPTAYRGRMLIGLFAFQAVGSVLASTSAANCVRVVESVEAWRWMVGLGAVPAAVGLLLCARLPESARWLLARDRILEAAEGIRHLIAPATLPDLPPSVPSTSQSPAENLSMPQVLKEMASPKMRRDSILAVVPWFLCDALHFSIVMFAPFILEKLLQADGLPFLEGCIRAAQANLLLSGALLIGFGLNCWMIDRVGRMKLQAFGFLGMAASLAVLGQFAASWQHRSRAADVGRLHCFQLVPQHRAKRHHLYAASRTLPHPVAGFGTRHCHQHRSSGCSQLRINCATLAKRLWQRRHVMVHRPARRDGKLSDLPLLARNQGNESRRRRELIESPSDQRGP